MNLSPQQPTEQCLLLVIMMFFIAIATCLVAGCSSSRYVGPDPALFPDKAKEYNDGYSKGFKVGFNEGLIYNVLSQP